MTVLTKLELHKGYYGLGLLKSDEPKVATKPWPAPHHINVWPEDCVHRLDAVDLIGALCVDFGYANPGDARVQAALERCAQVLLARGVEVPPSVWCDAPSRTKDEVLELLKEAGHAQ